MDPEFDLPREQQKRLRELTRQRDKINEQIQETTKEIAVVRGACKHQAVPGTHNHYATYCRLCGYTMDRWL